MPHSLINGPLSMCERVEHTLSAHRNELVNLFTRYVAHGKGLLQSHDLIDDIDSVVGEDGVKKLEDGPFIQILRCSQVLSGERVGTLFHQDAGSWISFTEVGAREMAVAGRDCSRRLQTSALANSVHKLADMEEPIGRVLKKIELTDGLILDKISCPLGVPLIFFESHPDALVQIASLAIRSGNGLLLKGGKEARRSNAILHKVGCFDR